MDRRRARGVALCLLRPRTQSRRGVLLLVVLGIVVTLSLIGYSMSFKVRIHTRIADNAVREAQARQLAAAAVEHAIAVLLADETMTDGVAEVWQDPSLFEPLELGEGMFEVSVPDASREGGVYYGLEDECAKLNLNTATRDQLLSLAGVTEGMADALIDWRDEDDFPGLFGAESDYYAALEDEYSAKNANLTSVRELLLVRDFDETALYGEDANGNGQLDPNEDDGDISMPNDDADGILDEGLLRFVTVYSAERNVRNDGQPRVNIQSASAEQLRSAMRGLTSQQADSIVQHRQNTPFESIGDLFKVPLATDDESESNVQGGGSRGSSGNSNSSPSSSGNVRQGRGSLRSSASSQGPTFVTNANMRAWADAITASEESVIPGKINLNTAPTEVLATVPGLTDDDIAQIMLRRGAGDTPFETVGDLFLLPGMNATRFTQAVEHLTTRSSQFTVRAKGKLASERARKEIEAVLERDEDGVRILYWRET